MLEIRADDLSGEPTRTLLALHLAGMQSSSPPESVFALDLSGLEAPGITVWTAWLDGEVAAVGALRMLGNGGAEIKSMRTHPNHLRKGMGRALLRHMIQESRSRSLTRLSLETGSGPIFEPALTLYRSEGFQKGETFSDYVASGFNQFLHLNL